MLNVRGIDPADVSSSFTNVAMARAVVQDLQPKAPPGAPGA